MLKAMTMALSAIGIKLNDFSAIFGYFWSLVHMTVPVPFPGRSGKTAITPSFSTFSSPKVYLLTAPSRLRACSVTHGGLYVAVNDV